MHDWLTHRVRASPDATALVRAGSGAEWTFAELDEAVERAAGRLAALGIEPGDHLGLAMSTRVASVVSIHAGLRLGASLVPTSDRLTASELAVQFEAADVTAVVCDETTEDAVVEAAGDRPVVTVDDAETDAAAGLSEIEPEPFAPGEWALDDTQLLLFTSGTTGRPKVVRLTLRNLLFNATASTFRLGILPDDRWLVPLSLHHMGGIGPILRSPLYGMEVVIRERFDAGGVVDDIDRYGATGVSLVPTMLQRMLDSRGTLSDSLRVVLLGGAPAPDELIERCRNYSVPVYPSYGMTETASQIATATPEEAFDAVGTVGRPLFWTDLWVVDEDGTELPRGEIGEFVVRGPTVSPGYYGDPEATADAFGMDGFHTGDVGYRDETGRVYVLNRKDDRIVTGGENVDPGEVVAVLQDHPDVEDAAVAGVPDEEWGERVAALVVPVEEGTEDDETVDPDDLESFCRKRLAGYKLPRRWVFADEIPRTISGTVERAAVRDRLRAAVEVEVPDAEGEDVPPAGDADDGPDGSEAVRGSGSGSTRDAGDEGGRTDRPPSVHDDAARVTDETTSEPAANAPDPVQEAEPADEEERSDDGKESGGGEESGDDGLSGTGGEITDEGMSEPGEEAKDEGLFGDEWQLDDVGESGDDVGESGDDEGDDRAADDDGEAGSDEG